MDEFHLLILHNSQSNIFSSTRKIVGVQTLSGRMGAGVSGSESVKARGHLLIFTVLMKCLVRHIRDQVWGDLSLGNRGRLYYSLIISETQGGKLSRIYNYVIMPFYVSFIYKSWDWQNQSDHLSMKWAKYLIWIKSIFMNQVSSGKILSSSSKVRDVSIT